ncbi:MAG TPA: enoyl-CoA hydratase-related protein [Iamia sp.]|nr:enoyl-CoA hydratase-related protein [Iamia sp.]
MTEAHDGLVVSEVEPGIVLATLDRPERLNALTFATFARLDELGARLAGDRSVRAVVVTGAGRGFCAGLDLDDAATLPAMSVPDMAAGQELWARAVGRLREVEVPVIAAVNGPAVGAGLSLALAADVRLAAPEARFGAAFVRIGLGGGDCGSSWTLPRIVGLGHASELLLTGRVIDAAEAERIGLVNRVVPAEGLLDAALDVAREIASNSPYGVRLTKRVLQVNVDAPSLAAAVELENRNQVLAAQTADMAEALTAFRSRRPAEFQDR